MEVTIVNNLEHKSESELLDDNARIGGKRETKRREVVQQIQEISPVTGLGSSLPIESS
jgi:hypothetical protein